MHIIEELCSAESPIEDQMLKKDVQRKSAIRDNCFVALFRRHTEQSGCSGLQQMIFS